MSAPIDPAALVKSLKGLDPKVIVNRLLEHPHVAGVRATRLPSGAGGGFIFRIEVKRRYAVRFGNGRKRNPFIYGAGRSQRAALMRAAEGLAAAERLMLKANGVQS